MIKKTTVFLALVSFIVSHNVKAETNMDGQTNFNAEVRLMNFTKSEKTKVIKAVDLIKQVVASEEFKQEVLNHTYEGRLAFADNKGFTNEEIYQRIIEASEKLSPGVDYTMDITLVAFFKDAVTVGYTVTNSPKIFMNRKFFGKQKAEAVTANIVHEWLHKIGFQHDVSATASRPFSVPYSVGYIVRRLAKNL